MSRRLALVIAAALPLVIASTASAEETPAAAPAEALAVPTPAPEVTPVPTPEALSELNWAGFGVRVGMFKLDVSAENVPLFNDQVSEALDAYNEVMGEGAAGEDAMDLKADLIQVVPTLHLGGDGFFFRLDLPVGFGDDITSFGLAMYPLAYGYYVESLGLFPYAAAGFGAHYATAGKVSANGAKFDVSQSGAFLQGRFAFGAKYRAYSKLNAVAEFGFSPWTVAGLVDTEKMDAIKDAEIGSFPPDPASAVRAGAGSSVDFSLGVEWQ